MLRDRIVICVGMCGKERMVFNEQDRKYHIPEDAIIC